MAALAAVYHVLSSIYLEDYSMKGVKDLLQTFMGDPRQLNFARTMSPPVINKGLGEPLRGRVASRR